VIRITSLFEAHLAAGNLERAITFYRDQLNFELAHSSTKPNAAFFWIGAPGRSMLGVWELGSFPLGMTNHVAFQVDLDNLLQAPAALKAVDIVPRGFHGEPADEAVVLAWMPAASVYFLDPDGNQLEFICMLADSPRPELGILAWSDWQNRKIQTAL
jgi:lactoylglutathione lyase